MLFCLYVSFVTFFFSLPATRKHWKQRQTHSGIHRQVEKENKSAKSTALRWIVYEVSLGRSTTKEILGVLLKSPKMLLCASHLRGINTHSLAIVYVLIFKE